MTPWNGVNDVYWRDDSCPPRRYHGASRQTRATTPVNFSPYPEFHWHNDPRAPAAWVPPAYRDLLLSRDSLTRRLKRRCRSDFQVRVLSECFAVPSRLERRRLGLRAREVCWIREVLLMGDGEPWVLARTLMPNRTLKGRFRRLRHLGRKPLGEVLFRESGWRRGPLEIGHGYLPGADRRGYARRSAFAYGDCSVLITEFFFPRLWHTEPEFQHSHQAA